MVFPNWGSSPHQTHSRGSQAEKSISCVKKKFLWCGHIAAAAAAAAKSLQLFPTLWDSIDGSSPGSPVPGILQARTLEWVAISFSNAWEWKVKVKSLSRIWLLATPWTAAYQAPSSMGFSRQEYWSGVPLSSPNNILNVKILKFFLLRMVISLECPLFYFCFTSHWKL